jgi:hypothetical protein
MKRVGTATMLLTICLAVHGQQSKPPHADENEGVIQGTLIYEDGKPVKDATVHAEPLDRAMTGIVPYATTDKNGHFVVAHLLLGKYAVGGEKPDEGYPNMTIPFYSDFKFDTVVVSSRNPVANVRVHLGPKAGILVGTVVDSLTSAPLNPCVEFRRAKAPRNFLSGTGLVNAKYRVLVPSDTGLFMKVWYGGHKSWYYPGTTQKTQSRALNLKPGEVMTIDIRLERDPNAQQPGCGFPVGTAFYP